MDGICLPASDGMRIAPLLSVYHGNAAYRACLSQDKINPPDAEFINGRGISVRLFIQTPLFG